MTSPSPIPRVPVTPALSGTCSVPHSARGPGERARFVRVVQGAPLEVLRSPRLNTQQVIYWPTAQTVQNLRAPAASPRQISTGGDPLRFLGSGYPPRQLITARVKQPGGEAVDDAVRSYLPAEVHCMRPLTTKVFGPPEILAASVKDPKRRTPIPIVRSFSGVLAKEVTAESPRCDAPGATPTPCASPSPPSSTPSVPMAPKAAPSAAAVPSASAVPSEAADASEPSVPESTKASTSPPDPVKSESPAQSKQEPVPLRRPTGYSPRIVLGPFPSPMSQTVRSISPQRGANGLPISPSPLAFSLRQLPLPRRSGSPLSSKADLQSLTPTAAAASPMTRQQTSPGHLQQERSATTILTAPVVPSLEAHGSRSFVGPELTSDKPPARAVGEGRASEIHRRRCWRRPSNPAILHRPAEAPAKPYHDGNDFTPAVMRLQEKLGYLAEEGTVSL